VEDTKPDDLTVIGNEPQCLTDELVDLSEESDSGRRQLVAKEQSSSPALSELSSLTPTESSDFESEGRFEPGKNEPVSTPIASVPEPQQAPQPRASKWADLPPHEPSTHIR